MNKALVIPNVDLELLEEQRIELALLLYKHTKKDSEDARMILTPVEVRTLDGLLNMLDSWSDNVASNRTRK